MTDWLEIVLDCWAFISLVTFFLALLESQFSDGETIVDLYRKGIRYTIDNSNKFSTIGKIVIIPIYTVIGILLPVPALAFFGPIFLVLWVIYQTFRLVFFKS